jgi:hypothetical protein
LIELPLVKPHMFKITGCRKRMYAETATSSFNQSRCIQRMNTSPPSF